jgi:transcriptional/translational regulatory protein YebC/TACO1
MFDRVGEISYPLTVGDAEKVMEAAIEAGADDVETEDDEEEGGHYIYTSFENMTEVAAALEKALGEAESVKAIWKPQNNVPVDAEKGATLVKLIGLLEDDDDVQNVYANFEMSDEDMAKLEA